MQSEDVDHIMLLQSSPWKTLMDIEEKARLTYDKHRINKRESVVENAIDQKVMKELAIVEKRRKTYYQMEVDISNLINKAIDQDVRLSIVQWQDRICLLMNGASNEFFRNC